MRSKSAILWTSLLWSACGEDPPPQTPLQIEQAERDEVVGGLRGRTYRAARGAVPEHKVSPSDEALVTTVAFCMMRQKRLALYEIERVPPTPERAVEYRLLRGVVYLAWKWPNLAEAEFRAALPPEPDADVTAKQMRAAAHLGLAMVMLHQKHPDPAADEIKAAEDLIGAGPAGQVLLAIAEAQRGNGPRSAELWGQAATSSKLPPEARDFLGKHGDKITLELLEDHPEILILLGAAAVTEVRGYDSLKPLYEKVRAWCEGAVKKEGE